MEVNQRPVLSGSKPGIIVRLGNLIIIQVIFVFAALALILFVPGEDRETLNRLYDLETQLTDEGEMISHSLDTDSLSLTISTQKIPMGELNRRFESVPILDRAALIRIADQEPATILYVYDRSAVRKNAGAGSGEGDASGFLDLPMLRRFADSGSTISDRPIMGRQALVYYRKLTGTSSGESIILAVAVDHGLSVSSRAGLMYAVLLLFLFAALISLLTVSLLLRKFKRPLDQIIAGLEETADGKLHHLAGLERDPELGKLARAYNDMTRRLWDNHLRLDSYYSQLEAANAELHESRSFLATMIDSSPLSVVVTNSEGKIVLFSRAAVTDFGYTPGEMVGQPFEVLLADQSEHAELPTDGNGPVGFEIVCRRKNSSSFPAYVVFSSVRSEDGQVLGRLYIGRDITETRNLQDMMIRVDRYYTKGEMVGDIAHEINNYLAVLLGNVELMPLLLKRGDMTKVEKKLDVMKNALEKIARFSDGLLDSPPDTVRLEPASLNQIVEIVIGFLKPQNKFDTVDVITELSGDIPVAHVDSGQVQQLLINLIYNAAEALAEKQDDRKIWVATEPTEINGQPGVKVTVRDNGSGVAADKEKLLFNTRFTTKRRGHGIGLMTCRKIVDNHKGSISYIHDQGAVFSATLPAGSSVIQTETCETLVGAH
jgi:PAS domain S-box-containing protein